MVVKKIKQIKNNKVIKIWDSVGEASKSGYTTSLIRSVCIGKRKTHKGCEWQYVNEDDIQPKIGIKKTIKCEYSDGNSIIFSSKKEASEILDIAESSIQNILLNRKKQYNNFKLSYLNE